MGSYLSPDRSDATTAENAVATAEPELTVTVPDSPVRKRRGRFGEVRYEHSLARGAGYEQLWHEGGDCTFLGKIDAAKAACEEIKRQQKTLLLEADKHRCETRAQATRLEDIDKNIHSTKDPALLDDLRLQRELAARAMATSMNDSDAIQLKLKTLEGRLLELTRDIREWEELWLTAVTVFPMRGHGYIE